MWKPVPCTALGGNEKDVVFWRRGREDENEGTRGQELADLELITESHGSLRG